MDRFKNSYPFRIQKVGDVYESSCPALDVFSQGDTQEEAIYNIREAVDCFIEFCEDMGALDQVLKEANHQEPM